MCISYWMYFPIKLYVLHQLDRHDYYQEYIITYYYIFLLLYILLYNWHCLFVVFAYAGYTQGAKPHFPGKQT